MSEAWEEQLDEAVKRMKRLMRSRNDMTGFIGVRLSLEEKGRLEGVAAATGVSYGEVVRRCIALALPRMEILCTVNVAEATDAEIRAIQDAKKGGKLLNGNSHASGGIATRTKRKLGKHPETVELKVQISRMTMSQLEQLSEPYGNKRTALMMAVERLYRSTER